VQPKVERLLGLESGDLGLRGTANVEPIEPRERDIDF